MGVAVGIAIVLILPKVGASLASSAASTSAKAANRAAAGDAPVIDLSRESLRDGVMRLTGGKGVDVIIDGVGGKLTGEALGCLLPGGTRSVASRLDSETRTTTRKRSKMRGSNSINLPSNTLKTK